MNRSVKHMANNNCTKRERFCPLPLLFSAKIPCQTTALQQRTRLPVSRRYTAGRGQPALRKRSEEKPSVHRNGRMGHPALRKHPEESRPFTEKNNQINRSIQKGTPDSVPFHVPRAKRTEYHSLPPFGEAGTGRDRSAAADRIKFPIKVRACT